MGKKNKESERKREWADVNEDVKFVCQGGKVQCPFATPPIADIVVTSNTVMLQDKPFATVKDKDGKVNFNFTGVCTHPSQQKPFSPPPPCKAVISLGEWKDFSDTKINDDNALLVKSTIPCMVSGQDIKIIHSGQKAELTDVEPKVKREPKITDVYWMTANSSEKNRHVFPDFPVTLYIETEDYETGEQVTLKGFHKMGKQFKNKGGEISVSAQANDEGIAIIENFIVEYEK
jgi:hypothetical protein